VHNDRVIVEQRIEREVWQRVLPHLYDRTMPLTVEAWHAPGEPVTYDEAVAQRYEPFTVGSPWSRPWGTTWFRCTVDVPADWVGSQLEAVIDLGFHNDGAGFQAEGLVWLNGEPLQGVHPRRTGVPLTHIAAGPLTFYIEAASNPGFFRGFQPTAMGSLDTAPTEPIYRVKRADLALRNDDVFGLLLDAEVANDVMRALSADDPRRAHLLRALEHALNVVDVRNVAATAADARAALAPVLAAPARPSAMHVVGVGHAHIDSAWLWPLRETIRKCARTFASATRLMDDYPEYRFVCSQAAQYDWIEQRYPALFERIRERVARGQFVPVGGMWVEADMNLPSGESIVRQMVYGQRYFESRFGLRCSEVWIPDVFGYPASLPQIFASGGATRFITQKLSWNKQNRFPHNTFWWEGLDGTRVLTHFPPVDTYNAEVVGKEMAYSERNFQDHDWSGWALMPYGHGNGGGGPTREMVERGRRMADLDGVPRLTMGSSDDFFDHVEAEIADGAPVPQWRGELYFEMHRGTLTSQIETKVGNRRCERLLREAELWWAAGGTVPTEVTAELDELWREVLLQQFHDIIPGSSIAWVHDDAEAAHARVAARLEELISAAFGRLALPAGPMVANAATHARTEVIEHGGTPLLVSVPGSGVAPVVPVATDDRIVTTEHTMANGSLCVQWDLQGSITSIIDVRRGRELLPERRSITVELAPDQPVEYDAWDLEAWTRGLGVPLDGDATVEWVRRDPLIAQVRVSRAFGTASHLAVTYTLRADSPRLDLAFDIDWHESERLLSLMVPLDVHATEAACDIQFGHVRRPTHASSPWDAAKFEVCAHRYVDLAEPSFGVAVLNDGRFGHSLFDGGIRVSLLRAARFPDPDADQGHHDVTISVLPHGAGLHEVLAEAEALNMPLRIVEADGTGVDVPAPVVSIDRPGVELSAVKRADDGSGDLIVRLYEACGDRTPVTVRAARPIKAAQRCNALEEPTSGLDVADGIVVVTLRPFELVTLRLGA
jgi:alpha-mannosidase